MLFAVQSLSCVRLFATPWTAPCQASVSFTISWSLPNSYPLSQWYHPTISFSVTPFSSCPQSFLESGSFPMSWLFASDGQRIGASASASVFSVNIQGWSPLGWTGLIFLLSKGLSRVFSSTTVQRHQSPVFSLFYCQLSHPYMTNGKAIALTRRIFVASAF